MNQKTESEGVKRLELESEFSPGFIRWLLVFTFATLFLVFTTQSFLIGATLKGIPVWFSLRPWIIAAGVTVAEGINEFVGRVGSYDYSIERYLSLVGLLISFILAPSLFMFAWRASYIRQESEQSKSINKVRASSVTFVLGGMLTLALILPSIPGSIVHWQLFERMKSLAAVEEDKDYLIFRVNKIAADAYQYWILPTTMGGGGNSYQNYVIPMQLASNESGTFTVSSLTGNSITFMATSTKHLGTTISAVVDSTGSVRVHRE